MPLFTLTPLVRSLHTRLCGGATYASEPGAYPGFNTDVPGRPSQGVGPTETISPADPQGWKALQFNAEFEAYLAETHLNEDSTQLLQRTDPYTYAAPRTQAAWQLWCQALALGHSRTPAP